jgi:hypothetical protein
MLPQHAEAAVCKVYPNMVVLTCLAGFQLCLPATHTWEMTVRYSQCTEITWISEITVQQYMIMCTQLCRSTGRDFISLQPRTQHSSTVATLRCRLYIVAAVASCCPYLTTPKVLVRPLAKQEESAASVHLGSAPDIPTTLINKQHNK